MIAAMVGCYKTEPIRSYPVAKEPKAAEATPQSAAPGEATDRMLAAVVPVDGQAWFFKLVGPVAEVDKSAADIEKFFGTIRIENGQAKWDTPADWKEDGPRGIRAATLWVPAGEKPLEMSIMQTGGSLLDNVNRWRVQQMKLPPVDEAQLKETTREVKAGDHSITIVDLKGQFAGMGMMAPFAGGAGGPGAGGTPPELPPGHPPIDTGAPDGNK